MIRLGVLGSTRGTHLQTLVTAIQDKRLAASIEVVISNKQSALILANAQSYGLNTKYIDATQMDREAYDEKVATCLVEKQVQLVVLIGYMRILSASFVEQWQKKIINVHPSLLPAFAGKMDLDVHRAVIASGVTETGCTVHYVTPEVDAGPILLQKKCKVYATDTPEILKARVQALEGEALLEAIRLHQQ